MSIARGRMSVTMKLQPWTEWQLLVDGDLQLLGIDRLQRLGALEAPALNKVQRMLSRNRS
jgi:hypothetical protein